jgi:DNA-binding transcriptional LysR family regulator
MLINSTQNYSNALLSAIQQANEDKVIISIGIIEKLNLDYIYTALGHIQEQYKNVTLYIESIMAQELIFKQAGGKFDMIITHEHLMHNISHIQKHVIGRLQHALIISKNHPNYREVLSGRAMTETIFYPSSDKIDRYSSDFQFIVSTYGFKPKTIVGMPNLDSILIAVKGGGGVAFLDTGIWLQPEYELAVIPTGIYFNEIAVWPSLPKDSIINDIGNSFIKEVHELRKGQFEN